MIEFTRIKNDVNGNPRYVCHYTHLLTEEEKQRYQLGIPPVFRTMDNMSVRYQIAVKRANKIGGRKYHTKAYGGGIVFQSYSLKELENYINKVVAEAS